MPRRRRGVAACLVGALLTGAASAPTATPVVPADVATMKLSFAPIVRRVAPAVVNVFSKRIVRQQVDPFWAMFNGGGLARERLEQSLGSGSIVSADGVILTNHHNIEGAREIQVVTSDRREWPATVLLDDARADLAVLKIDAKAERLPTLVINDAARPQVGDLVLAIGDPYGVGQTVTNGIVSALARSDIGSTAYASFIQTDAAINPGNSGGPLVDMAGDLIGVNTAIISGSGASAGIGFAIPAAVAKQVVAAALAGRREVERPWLGAKTQALTSEMARSLGLASPRGVVVTDVWPDGPAARAGLARGDVIQALNGKPIDDDRQLTFDVGASSPGATLETVVRRGGTSRTFRIGVQTPPETPPADARAISGRNPLAGATVANVSAAEAIRRQLDPFKARGVLVTRLDTGYGQSIGVEVGDFIRTVNGQAISTTSQLQNALRISARDWELSIERGGQIITARFSD